LAHNKRAALKRGEHNCALQFSLFIKYVAILASKDTKGERSHRPITTGKSENKNIAYNEAKNYAVTTV